VQHGPHVVAAAVPPYADISLSWRWTQKRRSRWVGQYELLRDETTPHEWEED